MRDLCSISIRFKVQKQASHGLTLEALLPWNLATRLGFSTGTSLMTTKVQRLLLSVRSMKKLRLAHLAGTPTKHSAETKRLSISRNTTGNNMIQQKKIIWFHIIFWLRWSISAVLPFPGMPFWTVEGQERAAPGISLLPSGHVRTQDKARAQNSHLCTMCHPKTLGLHNCFSGANAKWWQMVTKCRKLANWKALWQKMSCPISHTHHSITSTISGLEAKINTVAGLDFQHPPAPTAPCCWVLSGCYWHFSRHSCI